MSKRAPTLALSTAREGASKHFWPVLNSARNLGVGICGTRGIGKSQLLRLIAWLDLVHHQTPTFLIDPVGATTDSLLAHVCRFRPEDQVKLWPRIHYVNLSPSDYVVPMPLYYQTGIGTESLFTQAQRFPDTLGAFDPHLREASVEGFNSLWELATHGGRILIALGMQPSELQSLLMDDPSIWMPRLRQALVKQPEIAESVTFFTDRYFKLSQGARDQRIRSLLNKLTLLSDEATKAQFCANGPGLDWQGILRDKRLVIFDLRNVRDWESRRFKMTWLLLSVTDFLQRVGASQSGDRSQPVSLIIDEISYFFAQGASRRSPILQHFDAFINQQSRNFNVQFTCAFQEFYQLPPGSKETLMSLGTLFFGRMTDKDSMDVVQRYADLYGSRIPETFDWRKVDYVVTPQYLAKLPAFNYVVSQTMVEGRPPLPLSQYSVEPFVPRHRSSKELLESVRSQLSQRDGRPIGEIDHEIRRRLVASSSDFVLADAPPTRQIMAPPTGFDEVLT